MEKTTETRLDVSKVTHIKITDSFIGIETGWGIKQYKYCEATYFKFLIWKFLEHEAGYWRDGKQYSSCLSPMYSPEEIHNEPMYTIEDGWVRTNASVQVFVGQKLIKELYFTDLASAKRYCDINFHNVNFTI